MQKQNNSGWLMGARQTRALQKGQALILIAFAAMGIFAIMGLAIDGGGLLFMRRDTQNAADAAVMASAYALCANGNPIKAGIDAAARNGFVNGERETEVIVRTPPQSGPAAGKTNYVEVLITRTKPKYFIQLVYSGELKVTSRGIAYCIKPPNIYKDKAIFSMSPTCSWSANSSGSSIVITGDIFSNNQGAITGSNTVLNGTITTYGSVNTGPKTTFNPVANNPNYLSQQLGPDDFPPLFNFSDYMPGGAIANTIPPADYHWYSGTSTTTLTGTLSGVYVTNGAFKLNQTTIDASKGVTLIAMGNIDIVNNVKNQTFKSYLPNHLLFFSLADAGGKCGVSDGMSISGVSNVFDGIVYAPKGSIKLSGSSHDVCGALIAQTVDTSASSTIIDYCDYIPPQPPRIAQAPS